MWCPKDLFTWFFLALYFTRSLSDVVSVDISAVPNRGKYVLMESDVLNDRQRTYTLRKNWKKQQKSEDGNSDAEKERLEIKMIFALAFSEEKARVIEDTIKAVSYPDSDRYGKLLTFNDIKTITAIPVDEESIIRDFFHSFGIKDEKLLISDGFIRLTVPLSLAEVILQTRYHQYSYVPEDDHNGFTIGQDIRVWRCENYGLPEEIAKFFSFVAPTIRFPRPPSSGSKPKSPTDTPSWQNTPYKLRELYGVSNSTVGGLSPARQAVTAFLGQYYSEIDLQSFYSTYYSPLEGVPITKVVGPNVESSPGVEAALDVEYMTSLGAGVPTEFWSFAGEQFNNSVNEPFLEWLMDLSQTENPPLVFSTSYGEDEWSVSYQYATRMNQQFALQSSRGISFLFSSGDSGVGSMFGACTTYTPMYPASSPYVTAVGATTGTGPETAAEFSSGGFSNRWATPDYQLEAVAAYLTTSASAGNLPESGLYNSSGRAFPDVSAQGTGFAVVCGGITYASIAGTSCSSPVFGGIIALINDARIADGKSPLGFLNPFLYKYAYASTPSLKPKSGPYASESRQLDMDVLEGSSMFTDVVEGNNPGCGTAGFYAAEGWDPVTGLGTPIFQRMLDAALALP